MTTTLTKKVSTVKDETPLGSFLTKLYTASYSFVKHKNNIAYSLANFFFDPVTKSIVLIIKSPAQRRMVHIGHFTKLRGADLPETGFQTVDFPAVAHILTFSGYHINTPQEMVYHPSLMMVPLNSNNQMIENVLLHVSDAGGICMGSQHTPEFINRNNYTVKNDATPDQIFAGIIQIIDQYWTNSFKYSIDYSDPKVIKAFKEQTGGQLNSLDQLFVHTIHNDFDWDKIEPGNPGFMRAFYNMKFVDLSKPFVFSPVTVRKKMKATIDALAT
jgi:hypothetical protein